MTFASFKSQLAENRSKATALGVLTLVMLLCMGRLFLGGGAQSISAASLNAGIAGQSTSTILADDSAASTGDVAKDDVQKRIQESRELWSVLKEKRGLSPAEAFLFDASYYSLDPNSATAKQQLGKSADGETAPKVDDQDAAERSAKAQRAALVSQVREEAKSLILQSTVLSVPPTAVLNSGIFRVNDRVGGFRIVAIKARQVFVEKDGVTLAIEMAR